MCVCVLGHAADICAGDARVTGEETEAEDDYVFEARRRPEMIRGRAKDSWGGGARACDEWPRKGG